MNPAFLVFAVLFGFAGYQEARRFQRQYGETPWRWDPWVWAAILFLSFLIGIVLLAIAERQGRNRAARQPAYSGGYVPQVPVQGYGQPAYAGGVTTASRFGIEPVPAMAAAPAAALPAAMWAADPTGRHQYRWWDGATWTTNVATNGVVGQDPL